MSTQSSPPPDAATDKPQTAASEPVQSQNEDRPDAKAEVSISPPSVFVNSQPMREELVQNAVNFLQHPKVRGSPIIYRRSFLEKKGLTKEEIEEAFRRVPDPSPTATSAQADSANQDGQLKSSNNQQQSLAQMQKPSAVAPVGAISKIGTQYQFHWSHAILAVGFLAASGAGTAVLFKNVVIPRFKSWIRQIVFEVENDMQSVAKETADAAKAAAAAAADAAKTNQELLASKIEEKRQFEEYMNMLTVQLQEMRSMNNSIKKLEGPNNSTGRVIEHDTRGLTRTSPFNMNGKAEYDPRTVRSLSPPASAEPSVAPHPKSYTEIMAMVQRGEKPPNIREINDLPPNPDQPLSNPRLAPRAKPWEVRQVPQGSSHSYISQGTGEGFNSWAQDNGVTYQLNEDSSTWWQQKNARITEIETEDEYRTASYTASNAPPIQRNWVPPQPPSIVMPEAAAAIRQPKSSTQRQPIVNDESESQPSEDVDELQRITKMAESGSVEIKEEGPE